MQKILYKKLQFWFILLPYKKCVTEKIAYIKKKMQPSKFIPWRFCWQYPLINYPGTDEKVQESTQLANSVYETEGPFHCEVCSREFQYNSDLKRHFVVHTNEKPFACESCDLRFDRVQNLKRHIKNKHPGVNTEQY